MNLTEKVAFIKGLAEGTKLDTQSQEGKILAAMVDLLDDMAATVSDLDDDYGDLCDQVDSIDDDLYALEEDVYRDDEDDEDEEDFFYEVVCPTCNKTICLSEDVLLDGETSCPNCGEELEFDFDDICDCDDDCCCESGCECHE